MARILIAVGLFYEAKGFDVLLEESANCNLIAPLKRLNQPKIAAGRSERHRNTR